MTKTVSSPLDISVFLGNGTAIPASPALTLDRVAAFMAASERPVAKARIAVP